MFKESKPKEADKGHKPSEDARRAQMVNKNHPGTPKGWPAGANVKTGKHHE